MLSYDERAAEWRRRFDEQRASGLSVLAWCREHRIEKNTFYGWRRRLAQPPAPAVSTPQFIAVSVERRPKTPACLPSVERANVPPASLRLRIGHIAVEVASGFDAALLDDVLTALESRARC